MSIIFGILLALVIFSVIVFFHELGHFLAARHAGVKVEEFGLGIPPKATTIGKDSHGTIYTLNWLPIGGFVRLKGEDQIEAIGKDSFSGKGYFARSRILLAGVTMNFLFAWILFFSLFWSGTNPGGVAPIAINTKFATNIKTLLVPTYEQAREVGLIDSNGIRMEPMENSPAMKAGVIKGDIAVRLNDRVTTSSKDIPDALGKKGDSLKLVVLRDGAQKELTIIPENGKIGAYISDNITKFNTDLTYTFSFADAAVASAKEVYGQSVLTLELLQSLVRKIVAPITPDERTEATKSLSGPIGIGNVFIDLVKVRVPVSVIVAIAALISINLGVFNLLPFPALDGGRFAFLTIHTLLQKLSRGKFGTAWIESRANIIGFILLILISIFVAYQDIARIITG